MRSLAWYYRIHCGNFVSKHFIVRSVSIMKTSIDISWKVPLRFLLIGLVNFIGELNPQKFNARFFFGAFQRQVGNKLTTYEQKTTRQSSKIG